MRRFTGLALVVVLMSSLLATAAVAVELAPDAYRDEFNDQLYNGSDGFFDWSSEYWQEIKDDNEIDDGAVHVDSDGCGSKCLHIYGEGDDLAGVGARRTADTSVFSSFELCYNVRFEPEESDSDAVLKVEKQVNGSGPWYLIDSYDLDDESFEEHPVKWIGGPYESMTLRFTVTGELDGEVFIDDVEIKGEPVESTTTTTSSTTTSTSTTSSTTTVPTTTTTTKTGSSTSSTTTTTISESTTTTLASTNTTESEIIVAGDPPGRTGGPPEGSGIRDTAAGLQVAFDSGLFGAVGAIGTYFVRADHDAAFRVVAEAIAASWIWMVVLGVLIAWAIVTGLDRNLERSIRRKMTTPEPASD